MRIENRRVITSLAIVLLAGLGTGEAQPLGTFRWQQTPYCNVITLNVVRAGAIYQLDGFDDECGAPNRSAVIGTAFANPDGSIGMGLTIVTHTGASIHLDATLALTTFSGTWRTDSGTFGEWIFTPGPGHPGGVRPPPTMTSVTETPGILVPTPLTAQTAFPELNESIVVPRSGRLMITKNVGMGIGCLSTQGGWIFLMLDGIPLRGSAVFVNSMFAGQLTAVTPGVVAAGPHVLGAAGRCNGPIGGRSLFTSTIATVIVLP